MPPGAAKMASAGTALARSMSCAFTLAFSGPVRVWPEAALASSVPSSPVSRTSTAMASRFSITTAAIRSTIRSPNSFHWSARGSHCEEAGMPKARNQSG